MSVSSILSIGWAMIVANAMIVLVIVIRSMIRIIGVIVKGIVSLGSTKMEKLYSFEEVCLIGF